MKALGKKKTCETIYNKNMLQIRRVKSRILDSTYYEICVGRSTAVLSETEFRKLKELLTGGDS